MTKVLFICHGNICRSPMAEYVFRNMVENNGQGDQFHIESAATSTEELGNPVHPGTKKVLSEHGIYANEKRARQITIRDYEEYDYLIGMDRYNIKNMNRIWGEDKAGKIHLLLDFTDQPGDIADPWYTGHFQQTYQEVYAGCVALLAQIND